MPDTLDSKNLKSMSISAIKKAIDLMSKALKEPDVSPGTDRWNRLTSYISQLENEVLRRL